MTTTSMIDQWTHLIEQIRAGDSSVSMSGVDEVDGHTLLTRLAIQAAECIGKSENDDDGTCFLPSPSPSSPSKACNRSSVVSFTVLKTNRQNNSYHIHSSTPPSSPLKNNSDDNYSEASRSEHSPPPDLIGQTEDIGEDTIDGGESAKGFCHIAEALLRLGANVRIANRAGWSASHIAAYSGQLDLLNTILVNAD